MCGIAVLLDPAADAGDLGHAVDRMAATLDHRGPDDRGTWVDPRGGVALGHRRLAIQDPSPDGHQPMVSGDDRWALVFNGELYNRRELAAGLSPRRLRGHSDTEVLLEAIADHGVRAVLPRLNGMFALAAWDRERRELWLARDHVGIKPLHYATAGRSLLAASELRAVRSHPDFDATLDPAAVAEVIHGQSILAPRTVHRDAWKLPPGHLLCIPATRLGRELPQPEPWWDPHEIVAVARSDPFRGGTDAAIDHLHDLLFDSVQRQMVSDVPLGGFLSGGIDSSVVVAMMQASSDRPVQTFSVGFDDPRFDEGPHAEAMARHLGTDHTQLRVRERDALAVVPELPDLWDEPFADSSQIPTLLVSRLARRSVTVALSGDGGDELFGGYLTYSHSERLWRALRWIPFPLRRGVGAWATGRRTEVLSDVATHLLPNVHPDRVRSRIERGVGVLGGRTDTDVLERLCTAWPNTSSPLRLPPEAPGRASSPAASPGSGAVSGLPFFERMMLSTLDAYLPDTILTKVDRASMSTSLEVRVPLLDPRVYRFAWRLPHDIRVREGTQKWILHRVLERYAPRELFERPKQGFSVPLGDWLRGPLRPWAEDLLSARSLASVGLLEVPAVRHAWQQHLDGRPRQDGLWNVLMFVGWHRRWASP